MFEVLVKCFGSGRMQECLAWAPLGRLPGIPSPLGC